MSYIQVMFIMSELLFSVWDLIQWFFRTIWINHCIESWIVCLDSLGRVIFIIYSYVMVKSLFLNLMKFCYSAFHFVLRVHTWLWWNSCHCFHVVYLKINAKCCRNFIKSKKKELTSTSESIIKLYLPEWDKATPLMKKVRFSCME